MNDVTMVIVERWGFEKSPRVTVVKGNKQKLYYPNYGSLNRVINIIQDRQFNGVVTRIEPTTTGSVGWIAIMKTEKSKND